MAAGPGPPPAEEEEAAAAAAAEAEAASRSAGHELGHCGRCPRARKRPLESGCSRRLVTHSRQLAETQQIPEPPNQRPNSRARRVRACARTRWGLQGRGGSRKEETHLGLRVPKEPSAAGGGAAIACPAGNVALALERRQGDVEVG